MGDEREQSKKVRCPFLLPVRNEAKRSRVNLRQAINERMKAMAMQNT